MTLSNFRHPSRHATLAATLLLSLPAQAPAQSGTDSLTEDAVASDSLMTATNRAKREALRRDSDPRHDGWETEVVAGQVEAQLKELAHWIETPEAIDGDPLTAMVAEDFACGPLRPGELKRVFHDEAITAARGDPAPAESATYHGAEGLAEALRAMRVPLRDADDVRVKFKLFRMTPADAAVTTTAYLEVNGLTPNGAVQINATWQCRWQRGVEDQPLKLTWIELRDYEEVAVTSPSQTLFADRTEAVFGANRSYREQLRYGIRHWVNRIESGVLFDFMGYHGLALGDVSGDGLDDLYVCQSGGLPNLLFVRNADGRMTDISAEAGVDFLDSSHSALLVDLDNDGDQDMVVATVAALLFLSNDGAGRFTLRSQLPNVQFAYSLAAADYDHDGDLDVYACVYHPPASASVPHPLPYHDANNGPANVLARNDGDWRFTDATARTGLDQNNRRWSYAAAWEDYDNDGDVDLYVANDFGRNCLYRNDGGRFTDVAREAGVEDIASGMSVSWGDYNHDGWMDLYVANMFSAAGGRITFQRKFKPDAGDQTRADLQRLARGNTLFENLGDGTFRDVSVDATVTMGRWAWSSLFADINNDGREDLIVSNGHVTGMDTGDL